MTYPRLIADIGGTNARFALELAPLEFTHATTLPCENYDSLLSVIHAYLAQHQLTLPAHVGIAIANPVNSDNIQMTNRHWQFSIREMQAVLGCETLLVLNDFTAQALAITQMTVNDVEHLNGPQLDNPIPQNLACAVLGPGTGLGVSGLIPDGKGNMTALAGEGGHVSFAPANTLECELVDFVAKEYGTEHISTERLLQGSGLTVMYRFFANRAGKTIEKQTPAEVTEGALIEKDELCLTVLSQYCTILGGFCADVALTLGAVGGVYISGGIIPRFSKFINQTTFRTRFEAKGRLTNYLRNIPVYIVEHKQAGLLGAAIALNNRLK